MTPPAVSTPQAPHSVRVFDESTVRRLAGLTPPAMAAVKRSFIQLSRGEAQVPPIMMLLLPEVEGEIDVKTAVLKGESSIAIKVASGFPKNELVGLSTSSGMMVIVSATTGFPEAVFLDNGYLTQLRTALAGAIAADLLARPHLSTVGIIGSGEQARYQTRALRLVRQFRRILVYGRRADAARRYASAMEHELGVEVQVADSPKQVVEAADILVTATSSQAPIVLHDWVRPGLHITAMGSDGAHKQELSPLVLQHATRVVCDSISQCLERGELHHVSQEHLPMASGRVVELGAVAAGNAPGRVSNDDITVCDLTGVGVQDTAIAAYALKAAQRQLN